MSQDSQSTGPRTESGKATSSRNALKHGLASGTILIPGEDPDEYDALLEALLDQYTPANITEELLVHAMAKHHWLKDRALRLQGSALAAAQPGELPATFSVLLRYQTTNERAFHKALATLIAMQKESRATLEQFVSQKRPPRAAPEPETYADPVPGEPDPASAIASFRKFRAQNGF